MKTQTILFLDLVIFTEYLVSVVIVVLSNPYVVLSSRIILFILLLESLYELFSTSKIKTFLTNPATGNKNFERASNQIP